MEISLRHMSPATPRDPQHLELLYERADARKNIHGGLFQQSHSRVRLYCYSTSAQHLGVIPVPHLGLLFPELLVGFCCTGGLWGGWVQLAVLWDVPSVRAWGGSCVSGILNSCPSQSSEDEKQRRVAAVGLPSPPHTVPAASLSPCLSTSSSLGTLWSQLHVSVSMPPTSSGEGVWAWCSLSCKQRAKSWLQTCLCPGEPRPGELQGEHLAYLGHHGVEG